MLMQLYHFSLILQVFEVKSFVTYIAAPQQKCNAVPSVLPSKFTTSEKPYI